MTVDLTAPVIDVSTYQRSINWSQVASTGVAGAWCRVSNPSGALDPTGAYNLAGAHDHLPFAGAYVVPRANVDPAVVVRTLGTEEHVMLDLEPGSGFWGAPAPSPGTVARYLQLLQGRDVWIYGPAWFVNQFQITDHLLPWIHPAYPTRAAPPIDPHQWHNWAYAQPSRYRPQQPPQGCYVAGWQFSSSGTMPGIPGALVDCNLLDPNAMEANNMRIIYNDARYVNRFLIDGVVIHLSPALFAHYKASGTPEITDTHDQTLKSLMHQTGLTTADLVKA
jgi:hypothetical protein